MFKLKYCPLIATFVQCNNGIAQDRMMNAEFFEPRAVFPEQLIEIISEFKPDAGNKN